jgi:putative ABC transport system permease protein
LGVHVGDTVTILATTADGTLNAVDASVSGLADIPIKELDDRFVAIPLDLATDLLLVPDRVSRVVVVLRDTAESAAALRRLTARLHEAGFGVVGKTWEDLGLFYGQVRRLYLGIFGFMGAVLVVVVLLATANSTMMAAAERTREIGTLRALGTRPSTIQRMFMAEAVLLAGVACVMGALLALAIRALLNNSGIILPPPPGVTHGVPLHIKLYGAAYAVAAVAMVVTVVLAAAAPARRAARIPIVEALAHV